MINLVGVEFRHIRLYDYANLQFRRESRVCIYIHTKFMRPRRTLFPGGPTQHLSNNKSYGLEQQDDEHRLTSSNEVEVLILECNTASLAVVFLVVDAFNDGERLHLAEHAHASVTFLLSCRKQLLKYNKYIKNS